MSLLATTCLWLHVLNTKLPTLFLPAAA